MTQEEGSLTTWREVMKPSIGHDCRSALPAHPPSPANLTDCSFRFSTCPPDYKLLCVKVSTFPRNSLRLEPLRQPRKRSRETRSFSGRSVSHALRWAGFSGHNVSSSYNATMSDVSFLELWHFTSRIRQPTLFFLH